MNQPIRLTGLCLAGLLALGACDKMKDAGASADADVNKAAADLGEDQCGAGAQQLLVGQSAGTLDPAALPAGTRVLFPGMPVTMDFRADRLNVEVGDGDKVARVFCG